jgi:hypothetical protein
MMCNFIACIKSNPYSPQHITECRETKDSRYHASVGISKVVRATASFVVFFSSSLCGHVEATQEGFCGETFTRKCWLHPLSVRMRMQQVETWPTTFETIGTGFLTHYSEDCIYIPLVFLDCNKRFVAFHSNGGHISKKIYAKCNNSGEFARVCLIIAKEESLEHKIWAKFVCKMLLETCHSDKHLVICAALEACRSTRTV